MFLRLFYYEVNNYICMGYLLGIPPIIRLKVNPPNAARYLFFVRIYDGFFNSMNKESVESDKIGLSFSSN